MAKKEVKAKKNIKKKSYVKSYVKKSNIHKSKSKKSVVSLFKDSFSLYFKNIYVSLPMFIWLLILLISISIFSIFLFTQTSINMFKINQLSQEQIYNIILSLGTTKFVGLLIKLFITFIILALIVSFFYLIFISSTLIFSRNIVKGIKEKSGFANYLKKTFSYGKYWWKYFIAVLIKYALVFIYIIIAGLLLFSLTNGFKTSVLFITLFAFLLIVGIGIYLFIEPVEYCLIYYDAGIFESFKISYKIIKRNYLSFLGLFILLGIFSLIITGIFSFIKLNLIVSFLFLTPYKALLYMLFLKHRRI